MRKKQQDREEQQQGNDNKENIDELARRIKAMRVKMGYSNYEYFSYDKNIPRAQYGRYEKGTDIRFSSLVKVVHAFGMTLSEFFEGFEESKGI